MKSRLLYLSIVLLSFWTSITYSAQASSPDSFQSSWKIRNVYRSEQGDLIVRFEDDARLFPAGNTLFFKKGNSLQQIEISLASEEDTTQDYSFVNGSLSLSATQADLYCQESNAELHPLSDLAKSQLERDLHSNKISIKFLPKIQEPIYLLQVKATNELIYVTSPRYNFHGNYDVWLISDVTGLRKKKIESLESPAQESSDLAGMIRFKNGGGLYIPGTIDLFLPPSKHRGTPILIRTKGGKSEELVRPSVSRQQLLRLGLKAPRDMSVISPCNHLND